MNYPAPHGRPYQESKTTRIERPSQGELGNCQIITGFRKTILWMIAGYLVLNAGFEILRIPPIGSGIPLGECFLILGLLRMSVLRTLKRMSKTVSLFPLLLWWLWTLPRIVYDASIYGIWAFRDGTQEIESLFLLIGYWFLAGFEEVSYLSRWLRRVIIVAAFYCLILPFQQKLQIISPKLPGVASAAQPILFRTVTIPTLGILSATWLIMMEKPWLRKFRLQDWVAGLLLGFVAGFGQARTIYLQIIIIGCVLSAFRSTYLKRWLKGLSGALVLLILVTFSGINLKGRIGNISLDFVLEHFAAISGKGEGQVGGSAAGVGQRLNWWHDVADKVNSSEQSKVIGLGYGVPLTSFSGGNGTIVREPHNSYISVWARNGVAGLSIWVAMQIMLFVIWWRGFQRARRYTVHFHNYVYLAVLFICLLISAAGEDAFEKPFGAIPYYFFFGVLIRYEQLLASIGSAYRIKIAASIARGQAIPSTSS